MYIYIYIYIYISGGSQAEFMKGTPSLTRSCHTKSGPKLSSSKHAT